jgi:hypothetical protein
MAATELLETTPTAANLVFPPPLVPVLTTDAVRSSTEVATKRSGIRSADGGEDGGRNDDGIVADGGAGEPAPPGTDWACGDPRDALLRMLKAQHEAATRRKSAALTAAAAAAGRATAAKKAKKAGTGDDGGEHFVPTRVGWGDGIHELKSESSGFGVQRCKV